MQLSLSSSFPLILDHLSIIRLKTILKLFIQNTDRYFYLFAFTKATRHLDFYSNSYLYKICCGVPQGSCLDPPLFFVDMLLLGDISRDAVQY